MFAKHLGVKARVGSIPTCSANRNEAQAHHSDAEDQSQDDNLGSTYGSGAVVAC